MTTYQTVEYRVSQMFSTLAVATASNIVLFEGEKWNEKDAITGRFTGRTKTGDGVLTGTEPNQTIVGTPFNSLPFDPGGIGGGATNLSTTNRTATGLTIASSSGDDADVPLATAELAGLQAPSNRAKAEGAVQSANNLNDVTNAATARANLGAAAIPVQWAVGNVVCPVNTSISAGNINQANLIYLLAFKPPRSYQTSEFGARITTAVSGSSFAVAIYGSDSNRLPTGFPLANTGSLSGAVATILSDNAVAELYDNQSYWMAGIMSANGMVFQGLAGSSSYQAYVFGSPTFATALGTIGPQRQISHTFGTPWPNLTSATTTEISGVSRAPVIYTRIGALL